jgi:hypothetical protein
MFIGQVMEPILLIIFALLLSNFPKKSIIKKTIAKFYPMFQHVTINIEGC